MNIVITGASRGLGKAIAHLFASKGHNLLLSSRNEFALYKAMEEISLLYPSVNVKAIPFDIGIKEQAHSLADWILQKTEKIDVLVNNAGSFIPGSFIDEADNMEAMMDINFYSAYHLTKKLLPRFVQQKSGHIFNMCSIASLQAYNNGGAYSVSKYALAGLSANLRHELKPHRVKVTTVYPGAVYTDSWAGSGIEPSRIMEAKDVAEMIYAASQLSVQACVEEIILRPQLGDL